jgi:hypothetical protein
MSYKTMGYNLVRRILANLDKCSKYGESNVVRSPWGIFKMYRSSKRGRFYSVSGSSVLHNGGGYRIGTFRRLLARFS